MTPVLAMHFAVAALLFNLVLVDDHRWQTTKTPLLVPVLAAMFVEALWLPTSEVWVAPAISIGVLSASLLYVIRREKEQAVRFMAGIFVLVGAFAQFAAVSTLFTPLPWALRILIVGASGVAGGMACRRLR